VTANHAISVAFAELMTSPTAAYSLRRYVSGYSGPLVNIMRDSDNATTDVYPDTNGDFPVGDVSAWAGAATVSVEKWYDQSGGGHDLAQTNEANQPTLVLNVGDGLPGVSFSNSSQQFMNNTNVQWFSGNGTWTASLVIQNADHTGGAWPGIFGYGTAYSNCVSLYAASGVGNAYALNYDYVVADFTYTSPGSQQIIFAYSDGSSLNCSINGINHSAVFSGANVAGNDLEVGHSNAGSYANFTMSEMLLYPVNLTSDLIGALYQNQNSYWFSN
jgi:hypothetical protein